MEWGNGIFVFHKAVNELKPKQNGWHFVYDIFVGILFNENECIFIKISLNFVHKGSFVYKLELV